MVEHNIKRYVCAIVIVFLISFIAICILTNPFAEGLKGIISSVSTGISITAIIAVFFVSYAWKWKFFKGWLVPFPNLNGCWEGCIKYNYDGKDSSRKIEVNIKQTFISIIVNLESKESHSKNFCGSFNIDKRRDEKQLIYSYFNEPDAKYRNRSPLHYGTTKLEISSDDKSMKGEYWTNRGSAGSISLKRTNR